MVALEFLIFKSVVAANTQVFVNQINVCFYLKLKLSWKLVSVSQNIGLMKNIIYNLIFLSLKS